MKRFYRISSHTESKPMRLIAAVVLAFFVMMFINGFIGSMGGLPAFIAFAAVFYLLRTIVSAGNRITHQLAMTGRREIAYLMSDYAAGYLLLWALLRLALTFSRVTGWGNINGASVLEYVTGFFEISMLERWVYLFSGILMFAFVMSLFPLVVIRRTSTWIAYALVDGALFALLCYGMDFFCRWAVGGEYKGRGFCLTDDLLLCGEPALWQVAVGIAGICIFTAAVTFFAFFYAAYSYGPRRCREHVDTSHWTPGMMKKNPADRKVLYRNVVLAVCAVLLVGAVMAAVFLPSGEQQDEAYEKVAEYLTKDSILGPMVYDGKIYIPVDEQLNLRETGTPQGYLADWGEDCDGRLYELTAANILYTDTSGATAHVQAYGDTVSSLAPVHEVEADAAWENDEVFLLWDEEWALESTYSHEPTGYTACGKEFVRRLEKTYGQVDYQTEDFADYDAYFSLCGYADMEQALTEEMTPGHWVGCILVKDNQFYYGNSGNLITGTNLSELLDVLGGY